MIYNDKYPKKYYQKATCVYSIKTYVCLCVTFPRFICIVDNNFSILSNSAEFFGSFA